MLRRARLLRRLGENYFLFRKEVEILILSPENVFNVAKEDLKRQAIRLNLTHENFEDFARRVKSTLYSMRREIIDNTIASMFIRLDLITKNRGRRTKY